MSEVSCRATVPLVAELRRRGLALAPLAEGLPFTVAELENPSARVPWDPFTEMLERASELLGGPDQIENLATVRGSEYVPALLRSLLPSFVGARPVYVLGARWVGPWVFQGSRGVCEDLPDGRLRQQIEILPEFRGSSIFFHSMRGILRATPQVLGLGQAVVEMEEDGRRAEYTISVPPSRSVAARLRRRFGAARFSPADLDELGFQQEQLRASARQVRRTSRELEEKTRMLETINGLGRELTRHTELAPLLDSLVGVLRGQFGFRGVRVSRVQPAGVAFESLGDFGDVSGDCTHVQSLRAGGRVVGRLEVWAPADGGPSPTALLQELLPWIAIALENARSFEILGQQTRRLEQEVTGRRRAERQLERAQRLDSIGRLAGGIAHDLNNFLTAITISGELAKDSLAESHPAREDVDGILEMCERAGDLLKRILTFSRDQVSVARPVDLNELVIKARPMLERLVGSQVDLVIDTSARPAAVMADPGQLEQVLVNLVSNGRDAMAGGGRLRIEISEGREELETGDGAELVVCKVSDTGTGVSAATRAVMFEPFFTTKDPAHGTGLGLSSVYGTVTHFGGTIDVESEIGKGTTLVVQLPRTDATVAMRELEDPGGAPGGDETLLLVEDEEAVRRVARRILEEKGYTVLEAPNGPDALAICEGRAAPIHALVTDIVMPGMDGRELARQVARLRPEVRGVVFMSGHASEGIPETVPERHLLLRKPFPSEALLSAVRGILGQEAGAVDLRPTTRS